MVALAASGISGQSKYPHNFDVVTRVLDDPTITHGRVVFQHGGKDSIDGFLARPKAEGRYPVVIVIAGNVITEEYIPNTCAALAVAGFVGLAPNIFHLVPPELRSQEERNKILAGHTDSDALQDIIAGIDYLRTQPFANTERLGVVGFCFGGKLALMLGSRSNEVAAVVPYHPGPTTAGRISHLRAPVLIHQGTADRAVAPANATNIAKMLKAQKTLARVHFYEGADHGFLAYTRPFYRPDHAKLSWQRTVEFLNKYLKKR
jgi:carboxymethylenebutenolidase